MGTVKVQNLSTITYRTDCFYENENAYHLRGTDITQTVTINLGTEDEETKTIKAYYKGYEKFKDINLKLPEEDEQTAEIGYRRNPGQNPFIVDKLVLYGSYTLGGMRYSKLIFERPAVIYPYTRPNHEFMLINELHINGKDVCASGTTYSNGEVVETFQNKALGEIICHDYRENPTVIPSGYEDYYHVISTCTNFTIGDNWEAVATNPEGYYVGSAGGYWWQAQQNFGVNTNVETFMTTLGLTPDTTEYEQLYENFRYGWHQIEFEYQFVFCSGQDRNDNMGRMRNTATTSDGVVHNKNTYLNVLCIPFISNNEREFTKSVVYTWTTTDKNNFNNAYGTD